MNTPTSTITWEVQVRDQLTMEWDVVASTRDEEDAHEQYDDLVQYPYIVRLVKITTTRETVKVNQ